jgi:hypothetical protein
MYLEHLLQLLAITLHAVAMLNTGRGEKYLIAAHTIKLRLITISDHREILDVCLYGDSYEQRTSPLFKDSTITCGAITNRARGESSSAAYVKLYSS